MSNFSFPHTVFKSFILQTHKNQGLFGKGSRVKLARIQTSQLIKLKMCNVWDVKVEKISNLTYIIDFYVSFNANSK